MANLIIIPTANWDETHSAAEQERATVALESGNVLFFPHLRFSMQEGEDRLLSATAAAQAKNISLDPGSGVLRGSKVDQTMLPLLRGMMMRFATSTSALIGNLLPSYGPHCQQARTSYRPVEIAGRSTSWRKDDTRLHVDSFPSSPTCGTRILRVFTNIHPAGQCRTWRLGEPFEEVAERYLRTISSPIWGAAVALHIAGVTKRRRSDYDHYMLRLHDRMKADLNYQSTATQTLQEFPAGSTWMVFTDRVSHAAMSGQYALEQTFHVPVQAMLNPAQSPLRILERRLGRELA